MANTLETIGREKLRELLAQCTEGQAAKFNRIYRSVDTIPIEDLGWAIQLCERTIANNTSDGGADLVHDCPGEAVGVDEPMERFSEECRKIARTHLDIAATLAQKVADHAKGMELVRPAQREIVALKKATRYLRDVETQLRLAGIPAVEPPTEPCTCTNEECPPMECAKCLLRMTNEAHDANRQRT